MSILLIFGRVGLVLFAIGLTACNRRTADDSVQVRSASTPQAPGQPQAPNRNGRDPQPETANAPTPANSPQRAGRNTDTAPGGATGNQRPESTNGGAGESANGTGTESGGPASGAGSTADGGSRVGQGNSNTPNQPGQPSAGSTNPPGVSSPVVGNPVVVSPVPPAAVRPVAPVATPVNHLAAFVPSSACSPERVGEEMIAREAGVSSVPRLTNSVQDSQRFAQASTDGLIQHIRSFLGTEYSNQADRAQAAKNLSASIVAHESLVRVGPASDLQNILSPRSVSAQLRIRTQAGATATLILNGTLDTNRSRAVALELVGPIDPRLKEGANGWHNLQSASLLCLDVRPTVSELQQPLHEVCPVRLLQLTVKTKAHDNLKLMIVNRFTHADLTYRDPSQMAGVSEEGRLLLQFLANSREQTVNGRAPMGHFIQGSTVYSTEVVNGASAAWITILGKNSTPSAEANPSASYEAITFRGPLLMSSPDANSNLTSVKFVNGLDRQQFEHLAELADPRSLGDRFSRSVQEAVLCQVANGRDYRLELDLGAGRARARVLDLVVRRLNPAILTLPELPLAVVE